MFDETGCAGVSIGRGAFYDPWIFRRTLEYLNVTVSRQVLEMRQSSAAFGWPRDSRKTPEDWRSRAPEKARG
jgi:tRNA-dihydrouridine synthase